MDRLSERWISNTDVFFVIQCVFICSDNGSIGFTSGGVLFNVTNNGILAYSTTDPSRKESVARHHRTLPCHATQSWKGSNGHLLRAPSNMIIQNNHISGSRITVLYANNLNIETNILNGESAFVEYSTNVAFGGKPDDSGGCIHLDQSIGFRVSDDQVSDYSGTLTCSGRSRSEDLDNLLRSLSCLAIAESL